MESLKIKDGNPGFDGNNFAPGHLCQINSKKAITNVKHRMAIQKTLDMITEKIQGSPTLAELASFLGLSHTYLFEAGNTGSTNLGKYRRFVNLPVNHKFFILLLTRNGVMLTRWDLSKRMLILGKSERRCLYEASRS